jgi:hypothetical protein
MALFHQYTEQREGRGRSRVQGRAYNFGMSDFTYSIADAKEFWCSSSVLSSLPLKRSGAIIRKDNLHKMPRFLSQALESDGHIRAKRISRK